MMLTQRRSSNTHSMMKKQPFKGKFWADIWLRLYSKLFSWESPWNRQK